MPRPNVEDLCNPAGLIMSSIGKPDPVTRNRQFLLIVLMLLAVAACLFNWFSRSLVNQMAAQPRRLCGRSARLD